MENSRHQSKGSLGGSQSGPRSKQNTKRGSLYGNNFDSSKCVEEIKNAFNAYGTVEEPESPEGKEVDDLEPQEDDEEEEEVSSPTKSTTTKKKSNQKLILCTAATRYNVIKRVCRKMEFKLSDDENADWDLYWSDVGV